MLNYVWIGLVILGIGTALTSDISEQSQNKYRNGYLIPVELKLDQPFRQSQATGQISVKPEQIKRLYGENISKDYCQSLTISRDRTGKLVFYASVGKKAPQIIQKIAKINGKEDDLTGTVNSISFKDSLNAEANICLEKVSFTRMKDVTSSALDSAGSAVNIALGLIGIMALWLGVMKIAEESGLIKIIAKALAPLTKLLFPNVPSDHPAMGAMIMNISANMLGLSNAATPFGLKAMGELDKLNPQKGTATNEMCTFLAINTAGLTLIPATAIAIRASQGSSDPAIIIGTSVFGAACATTAGICAAKTLEQFPIKKGLFASWLRLHLRLFGGLFLIGALIIGLVSTGLIGKLFSVLSFLNPALFKSVVQNLAVFAIPFIIFSFIAYGAFKRVNVYEKFVEGAKEGFNVAVRIIPYLVAMLVAIGIFRAGGAMDVLINLMRPFTNFIGMPAEVLPMALMRPLSGSGSLGVMSEIMARYGTDSLIGILASTLFGSSETTFYVLAVYFGSIGITKTRHALPVGLIADIAGVLGAVLICKLLFG